MKLIQNSQKIHKYPSTDERQCDVYTKWNIIVLQSSAIYETWIEPNIVMLKEIRQAGYK